MAVEHHCRRSVSTVVANEAIRAAASQMERDGVGLLAVLEDGRAVGVLTDRDLVLHAAEGPRFEVAQAMTTPAIPISTDTSLDEAIESMERSRVRRLLVIDGEGRPYGVLELDDLVSLIGRELAGLAEVADAQLSTLPDSSAPTAGSGGGARRSAHSSQKHSSAKHDSKEVVALRTDAPVQRAIEEMKKAVVGSVVVTDEQDRPVGIVTDRDIAVRIVSRGDDPKVVKLGDIMTSPAITADASQPIEEITELMKAHHVRRIPVLQDGGLAGLVSYDDLLVVLSQELQRLGRAVRRDVQRESRVAAAEEMRKRASEALEEAAHQLGELGELGEETAKKLKEEVEAVRRSLRRR